MKAFTYAACYAMAFGLVPLSFSCLPAQAQEQVPEIISSEEAPVEESAAQAQTGAKTAEAETDKTWSLDEAKEAINALPGAKDAVTGTIPSEVPQEIYDIYGRQLAYREGEKAYRESLEKRRESFAKPRTAMVERYKETQRKVHEAETAAYQQSLQGEEDESFETADFSMVDEKAAPVKEAVTEEPQEEKGLKEQEIPAELAEEGAQMVKKKVVTSEDAPSFDPARLEKTKTVAPQAVPQEQEEVAPVEEPVAEEIPVPVPVADDQAEAEEEAPAAAEEAVEAPMALSAEEAPAEMAPEPEMQVAPEEMAKEEMQDAVADEAPVVEAEEELVAEEAEAALFGEEESVLEEESAFPSLPMDEEEGMMPLPEEEQPQPRYND